ncbi:hypothetical protein MLD38_035327 [Melastoma candidum]|uniref:Uncharacterized protein n=1 Tax=Melastoma candidum TaxID=119954 RepID=A0ACB9LHA5_9MYRT|nr:hypothetical protein MLD38_035327 [Melastoma candidum]
MKREGTPPPLPKLLLSLLLFLLSLTYLFYTLKLSIPSSQLASSPPPSSDQRTAIHHLVFGIAASAKLWDHRKDYIKLWFKPEESMRGVVWLDKEVPIAAGDAEGLPMIRISGDTSHFNQKHPEERLRGRWESAEEKTKTLSSKGSKLLVAGSLEKWTRGTVGFEGESRMFAVKLQVQTPSASVAGKSFKLRTKNFRSLHHRSALRISRIVSETLWMGLADVRWFVMGDDDTVFVTENLVRVLNGYDHRGYYYIGSVSESHLQNIYFSYGMAYGGGGFAISYGLAVALEGMQDRCMGRYPGLYGSDDRIQACMAELGVPLTRHLGFHQFDVYGNLFGLLAAHPVTPLVSLHHLDIVEPIFPNMTRLQALRRLALPMKLDSAALMQQSICYDRSRAWMISISWAYAVQVFRGVFSPREMETPARTFLNWYKKADYTGYAFNTRLVSRNQCQMPFVFYLSDARPGKGGNSTVVSVYARHREPRPHCKWKMESPEGVEYVVVEKPRDPNLWDRGPRRNCCRVKETTRKGRLVVDVGVCGR